MKPLLYAEFYCSHQCTVQSGKESKFLPHEAYILVSQKHWDPAFTCQILFLLSGKNMVQCILVTGF